MKKTTRTPPWRLALAILALLLVGVTVQAAGPGQPPGAGYAVQLHRYVALYYGQHTVNGEFDGSRRLSWVNGFFAVPDMTRGGGFGLAAGLRTSRVGIGLQAWRSTHDSGWDDVTNEATLFALSVEARLFPFEEGIIRPYISAGPFWEWLTVENGYCSDLSGEFCRERFNGFGVAVGAGALVYLSPQLFVDGQVRYRHSDYDMIRSLEAGEGALAYTLDGQGWTLATGIGMDF